jgi:hypothetical protein
MKLSIFDGSENAYWWIICSEKSFNSRIRRVSDAEIFLPTLPALPRPSPKPPYPYTTVVSPPLMFIFQNHRSRDLRKDFTTSDQILAFKNASRLLKENSIRVILYELIMYRHVAVPNPVNMQRPKTVQFFTRLFIRLWPFNIICNL